MALANYGDLKTSIGTWIGRSDLTVPIPDFVALAHERIMRDLKHPRMLKRDAAFSITGEYVAVPSDFIELNSFRVTSTSPDYELRYMPNETQATWYGVGSGQPKFVTIAGNTTQGTEQFRFAPVPDGTYTAMIDYYAYITFFANDAATNWILTRYPSLYLFGSLLHAKGYVEDPLYQVWSSEYNQALAAANRAGSNVRLTNGMAIRPA